MNKYMLQQYGSSSVMMEGKGRQLESDTGQVAVPRAQLEIDVGGEMGIGLRNALDVHQKNMMNG